VLDYIRQSVEIIMNLNSEKTSHVNSPSNGGPVDSARQSMFSPGSCKSENLIMASMKDALKAMYQKAQRHKGDSEYV
jgi:hypothetical protein